MEMIWLLFLSILSLNLVLRLPAVVLTNHCQSYTVFFYLIPTVQGGHVPFFAAVSPNDSAFVFIFFCWTHLFAQMLLTPSWVSRRGDVKKLSINLKSQNLKVKN